MRYISNTRGPAEGDARRHRRRLDRGSARPHPDEGPAVAAAQPAARHGRDRPDPPSPAHRRPERGRGRPRLLPRRRLLRPRDPEPDQPPDLPRRVLHRLHAVPAGSQPGHAPLDLRVPDHDGGADRHGRRQRLDLRRRLRAGRGRADGPLGDRARHPADLARGEPALPPGRRDLRGRPRAQDRVGRRSATGSPIRTRCGRRCPSTTAAVVVQYPNFFGSLEDVAGDRGHRPRGGRAARRGRRSGQPGPAHAPGRAAAPTSWWARGRGSACR